VIDYSSAQLEMLRTFGIKVYFGDATRPDLLHAAGIAEAKLLVVAIDNEEQTTEVVRYVVKHYPDVHVARPGAQPAPCLQAVVGGLPRHHSRDL
jgi:CPA2 family monovalent cation:H+ antiporter-2